MKNTGIVRKVDQLGRVVLPKELRNTLNIKETDPLEIFVEGESVIFQKYKREEACIITGEVSSENMRLSDGLLISIKGAAKLLDAIAAKFK
ncbi:AbrB/MazE/SpoVT family DNA-binding domain-containing protein (plasmid) [Bacillus pumilus]|uniref:AbrB/MazE/SpoVT family DNA-binding domain-containing protein n=1 Tax=Bacillus pumilus TaxID=1408 RepID=UPI00165821C1|nr:AbrB/MazE/SpoVT family DNA-binding domain-containing protein [Bacillus pumilus]QNP18334.1 AbrB/MazE/SpoVT family DNA-binding domain-containing protein [Bacillus pumilus]